MFECVNLSVLCYHIVFFLVLIATTKESVEAQQLGSPAVDFKRYTVARPIVHHGRTKREIRSTKDTAGDHHKQVTVTVNVDGEEYVLDLRLNEELVSGDHIISYQKNGETVLHKPKKEELDLCQYSGTVREKPGSWVAVSTCHGISGVIHDGNTMKYIEPAEGNSIDAQHFIYDHSDLNTNYHCGYTGGVTNNTEYDPRLLKKHLSEQSRERSRISRYKREAYEDTEVRGPYNANKLSRYVELVLVADNREFRANGESIDTVHRQLKDVANIINSVYAPLNIFIALVGVVVWNERDAIHLEEDGDKTLTNFLQYRRATLLRDIPNDNAHLLTRQSFKDGVVGKALKGPICTYQFSGGVATNHSAVIGLVATTIAHEMGHNFGMEHDTEVDCECPDEKCIMSPSSTSVTPTHWSSCSLRSLALAFEKGMDYCLRNKPKRLFDSPTCGNGFVEAGEQCDCGLTTSGTPCTACCDPRTCTLRSNATCAVGACCDHTTCRPKTAGTVCRSASRECDLPEYCTGHSEYCPLDVHKMDATPCGNGQAYCVRGACRSHSDQCRLLWGSTGESSDVRCYTSTNTKGDKNGNCGYKRGLGEPQYFRCAAEDAMCGLLQCRHLNERLEFGMESVSQLSALFINNNGTIIPCRTAMVDLGLSDVDPGLVPDGAKCGEDKMCLNQRCVSVEMVRERIARTESSVCPSDCSGHGECNSNGHCHCEAGFAPPLCALPGPGGSYDSGPATDSSVQRNFMVAMYVIFLGILPSILLIMFLMYYSRHNVLVWWKKPKKTYVPKMTGWIHTPKINFSFRSLTNFSIAPSILSLLHVKSKNNTPNSNIKVEKNVNDCSNNSDNKNDIKANRQSWPQKLIIFAEKRNKFPVKSFRRKLNKDDIKIAGNSTELTDEVAIGERRELNSPHYENIPAKPVEAQNKLVIINTGLASTTNKNISNINSKINDETVSSNNSSKLLKQHDNSNVANNISNSRLDKYVSDGHRTPVIKQKIDKSKVVIINKGLSSTTNEAIIKTAGKNITKDAVNTKVSVANSKAQADNSTAINPNKPQNNLKINKGIVNKFSVFPSGLASVNDQVKKDKEGNVKEKSAEPASQSKVKNLLRNFGENSNFNKDSSRPNNTDVQILKGSKKIAKLNRPYNINT